MSMLGSPIGGATYLFADPSTVWTRPRSASMETKPAGEREREKQGTDEEETYTRDDGQTEVERIPMVRILLPAEETQQVQRKRTFPSLTALTGTSYTLSSQPISTSPHIPLLHSRRREQAVENGTVIPAFRVRRTVRLAPGSHHWELYAIDAWVLDRTRRVKCVLTGGGGADERDGFRAVTPGNGAEDSREEKRGSDAGAGVLVDEYVPIVPPRKSRRHLVDDRDTGTESDDDASGVGRHTWREHLESFKRQVENDGGRLLEIDWDAQGTSNGETHMPSQPRADTTKTYLPVTPLPYLAHGLHPIHIPSGSYKQIKERLWVNLNLRRLGCSGRSSVGLDVPSSATEHKFLTQYRLPSLPATTTSSTTHPPIQSVVLELVRLIQTALHIHGLYGHPRSVYPQAEDPALFGLSDDRPEPHDGLLCDSTMLAFAIWKRGIQRMEERRNPPREDGAVGWRGEDVWGLQEGELDDPGGAKLMVDLMVEEFTSQGPNHTALLLSEVMTLRCKLAALDVNVPRDPFAKPGEFILALREYQRAFHPSRPASTATEFLTPLLLEEINISFEKAQLHEATKFSRILKNQVVQARAGLANNLTGLASATFNSATSTGRHHGATDDESSDREVQEVSVPGGTSDKASPLNLTTSSIDRWVSLIKSGREGFGNGRVGDLWLGRVGNGMGKHWQWDTPRRYYDSQALTTGMPGSSALKRRNTHDDLKMPTSGRASPIGFRHVSAELPRASGSMDRTKHHARHSIHPHDQLPREPGSRRHRTRESISHGAGHFMNMTSKTGNALRDGLSNVTNRARKGLDLGDHSDTDHGRLPSIESRRTTRRSTTPALQVDGGSETPPGSLQGRPRDSSLLYSDYASIANNSIHPHISITTTAPSDGASSRTISTRPGKLQNRSVSQLGDSEPFSEGISDFTSDITRPLSRSQRSIVEMPTEDSAATVVPPGPAMVYSKLERMVSTDSRRRAVPYGQEFLHKGHNETTWIKYKRDKYRQRGVVRRYSFESVPRAGEIVRQHPKQLQVDVEACSLEMEAIMQRVSSELVADLISRRKLLEQLQSSASTILPSPSQQVEADMSAEDESSSQSTAVQVQRLLNRLSTDGKDLEYSVRNLQNTARGITDAANKIDAWIAEFPPDEQDELGNGISGGKPTIHHGVTDKGSSRLSGSRFGSWLSSLWKP